MKNNNMFPGIILIGLGATMLANRFGLISLGIELFWPLFLLIPGLMFEISYFTTGRNAGTLVPGGILTVYGLLFFFNILTKWSFMDSLWPIFILGPAVGLFQLYLFGDRSRGVLIASAILGTLSLVFLSFSLFGFALDYLAPVLLILLGSLILIRGKHPHHGCCSKRNGQSGTDDDLNKYYDMDDPFEK